MEVILLERIESLGVLGETVRVKPGYARNYLLPQGKALRATKDNIAYFETQRAALEKQNEEKRKEAEKQAKKLENLKIVIIRHAAEGGHLYGSVSSRDIAEGITAETKVAVDRNQVTLNDAIKSIGLFPVNVTLHPEVKVSVTVNIARSEEEAKTQAKTGRALVAAVGKTIEETATEAAEAAKAAFLEEEAFRAERERIAESSEEDAEESAERARKAAARAAKKAAKAQENGKESSEEGAEEPSQDDEG